MLLPFFFVAASDGAVQTRLVRPICEDVFWRLRHPIYPSLSARAARIISKRIANCHQGFILPQIKSRISAPIIDMMKPAG
jgi:hypothetical protein